MPTKHSKPTGFFCRRAKEDASRIGFVRHLGEHPAYSDFVARILKAIDARLTGELTSKTERPEGAYRNAARSVRLFQLYLKDGLVAQSGMRVGAHYPKFLLNGNDPQIAGGPGGQAKLRAVYERISFREIQKSRVFGCSSYRSMLGDTDALFDPNARNDSGHRLNGSERANLRRKQPTKLRHADLIHLPMATLIPGYAGSRHVSLKLINRPAGSSGLPQPRERYPALRGG